jgi:hypothetical protein
MQYIFYFNMIFIIPLLFLSYKCSTRIHDEYDHNDEIIEEIS